MLALASRCAVLIVEDHEDTAGMLIRLLKRRGVTAESVATGMEALEFLDVGAAPKCVILDHGLPGGMDGLELFRQLKARPTLAGIPVIFYSASYEWQKQMEAEALGAAGWYIKGVASLKDVFERVDELCGDRTP